MNRFYLSISVLLMAASTAWNLAEPNGPITEKEH